MEEYSLTRSGTEIIDRLINEMESVEENTHRKSDGDDEEEEAEALLD